MEVGMAKTLIFSTLSGKAIYSDSALYSPRSKIDHSHGKLHATDLG